MKCYKCNGTGYYDIDNECPVCDGTGEYEPFDADVELDKLYPTEQTEQEYIQTCNTEQLAEVLCMVSVWGYNEGALSDKEAIEWLKQPHMPKE